MFIIVIVQVLLQGASFAWWCYKINEKKKELAENYGYLLVFPIVLI